MIFLGNLGGAHKKNILVVNPYWLKAFQYRVKREELIGFKGWAKYNFGNQKLAV